MPSFVEYPADDEYHVLYTYDRGYFVIEADLIKVEPEYAKQPLEFQYRLKPTAPAWFAKWFSAVRLWDFKLTEGPARELSLEEYKALFPNTNEHYDKSLEQLSRDIINAILG
jgi:hypothetical protein